MESVGGVASGRRIKPIIKWAGGKRQLIKTIRRLAPSWYGRYFEPFLGGGAVLFDLEAEDAVANDSNRQLINLYRQVRDESDELIGLIRRLDSVACDREFYLRAREKYNEKIAMSICDVESAALMVWLNKHCFNGLYRTNKRGMFNVSFNNRKSGESIDEDNLRAMSAYLNSHNVELRSGDFEEACDEVKAGDFVYFDSPYIPMSKTANFTKYTGDGFHMEEHERLARLFRNLDKKGAKLMLSNNDTRLARELYKGFDIHEVDANHTINPYGNRNTCREIIVTNY